MVAAAAAAWLATPDGGAGDRGIELCKGRVLAFYHSGIVSGVALILSVYMHSGAGPTQENWQLLSTIGQWLTSQALPFIIGGDFQVEPKQLEDSGWVRTVGGFVVTPQPSHRVTDFFVVSRDLAGVCEAITHVSQHIAPHRPVRIVVSTRLIQPKKRVMSRPKPWPAERPSGCRKREHDLDWDPVRRLVQAAAGAQAGCTSFIDAVEEELVDAFLMALEEADAFRGRSQGQKLVWKACKSPWCDKFPCGGYEMQSWRRKALIYKHILTARQRLDELLLGEKHIDHTRTLGLVHECWFSPDRHTNCLPYL